MPEITIVSPFSTGGGGTDFEWRVATFYVASMMANSPARGASAGSVTAVKLQQRNLGNPVDDVIVVTSSDNTTRTLFLQAKHALRFTDSELFEEVLRACWNQYSASGFSAGKDRIGTAIGDAAATQSTKGHLQNLLETARTSSNANSFVQKVTNFTKQREYLNLFSTVLQRVAGREVSNEELLGFLRSFVVLYFDFGTAGSRDSWFVGQLLASLFPVPERGLAPSLCSTLFDTVARFSSRGGELTADTVQANIPPELYTRLLFRVRSDLPSLERDIATRLLSQVQREQRAHRFIPAIFCESNLAKEHARYFVHPSHFQNKILEELARITTGQLDRYLVLLGLPASALPNRSPHTLVGDFSGIEANVELLRQTLRSARDALAPYEEGKAQNPPPNLPTETAHKWREVFFPLSMAARTISWRLDDVEKSLKYLSSSVLMVVARAGQGKTNFICDLVSSVIRPLGIPALFVTSHELKRTRPEKLADSIFAGVLPNAATLEDALVEVEGLCSRRNAPLVVVIDGLNEHPNISEFSLALENLVERLVSSGFVRCVLACREEYFDQRFDNLATASFAPETVFIRDTHGAITNNHKNRLLSGYFGFFKLSRPYLAKHVEGMLKNDPLLLRLFCEAYGDSTAGSLKTLPPQNDIYKDGLFKAYIDKKMEQVVDTARPGGGQAQRSRKALRRVLAKVVNGMIDSRTFADFPLTGLDASELEALDRLLDEDVVIRKDLVSTSVLDADAEVLNFTLDEFRDFLVADQLVTRLQINGLAAQQLTLDKILAPLSPVAEGVARYLFYAAKRNPSRPESELIVQQPWYEEVFLECIFSVEPNLVTDEDAGRVKHAFVSEAESASRIINGCLRRWRPSMYAKLNMAFLFECWDSLSEKEFKERVGGVFPTESHHYGFDQGSPALSPKNSAGLLTPCRPSWWHENPKPDQAKIITAGIGCRYQTDTGRQ